MQFGLLNKAEPNSVRMLHVMLREICGEATEGEEIYLGLTTSGSQAESIYCGRTVSHVLECLGYRPRCVTKALALVCAELEDTAFTGLAIDFGAGTCDVCLAHLGVPVVAFSTSQAGDYIDESCALVTGNAPAVVRTYKERKFSLNRLSTETIHHALAVFYRTTIEATVGRLEQTLADAHKLPTFCQPISVVLSGGSVLTSGFKAEFAHVINRAVLPFGIREVRLAEDPLNATARGALRAASLIRRRLGDGRLHRSQSPSRCKFWYQRSLSGVLSAGHLALARCWHVVTKSLGLGTRLGRHVLQLWQAAAGSLKRWCFRHRVLLR